MAFDTEIPFTWFNTAKQWKKACITPIPKVTQPAKASDYRPISITPVLSRMLEKHLVKTFIYPAFQQPPPGLHFADQFAFRPTGSTDAALITLLHTSSVQFSSVTIFMSRASLIIRDYDGCAHA